MKLFNKGLLDKIAAIGSLVLMVNKWGDRHYPSAGPIIKIVEGLPILNPRFNVKNGGFKVRVFEYPFPGVWTFWIEHWDDDNKIDGSARFTLHPEVFELIEDDFSRIAPGA